MAQTAKQNLSHQDLADPETLNRIIWFSVKGKVKMPEVARLPVFDAMRLGLSEPDEAVAEAEEEDETSTKKRGEDE